MSISRHSRAMLLNVLWHHQGGSSRIGQPIRTALGIDQYARLSDEEIAEAKWIDGLLSESTMLRAELAAASVYKPCRRKDTPHVPVKAIGECNFDFFGVETDEEFLAWGKPHTERVE